jgi:hypothetical protein
MEIAFSVMHEGPQLLDNSSKEGGLSELVFLHN